jgi:drug/metabolite transporter (DMT)-like permease
MSIRTTSNSYFLSGVFFALAGAICFSTKAIFVKLAYFNTTVDAVTLLGLRMIFSLPFFVVSAIVSSRQRDNIRFTSAQWVSIAFVGCIGYYVSSLLDFLGLQYVSAGIERLILFIYPTLVVIISSVVFKVKIKLYQWLAILITYGGLLVAFWGEVEVDNSEPDFYKGALFIFACAITYAIYIVGSGRMIPQVGASKFNSYAMSFACVAVVIHFLLVNNAQSLFDMELNVYIYSFSMAILGTVIPSYLVTAGIKRIGSDNAAIIGSIGPVSTIIQAYFFLDEPILALQLVGTGLILVGVMMIGRKPGKTIVTPGATN